MKTKSNVHTLPQSAPTEDDIRDYAFHLYEQSGCVPARDLENWLDAKACLEANIPKSQSHTRPRRHRHAATREAAPAGAGAVATPAAAWVDQDDDENADTVIVEEIIVVEPPAAPDR